MTRERGLALTTTEASLTARPFFQSRGLFAVTAQEMLKRGQTLRNFRMEKLLADIGQPPNPGDGMRKTREHRWRRPPRSIA